VANAQERGWVRWVSQERDGQASSVLELRLAAKEIFEKGQPECEIVSEARDSAAYVTPAPMAAVLLTPPVTVLSRLSA